MRVDVDDDLMLVILHTQPFNESSIVLPCLASLQLHGDLEHASLLRDLQRDTEMRCTDCCAFKSAVASA